MKSFIIHILLIFLISSCGDPNDIQSEYFDIENSIQKFKYKGITSFNFDELDVISRAGKGFEKTNNSLKKYLMISLNRDLNNWKDIDYYYHSIFVYKEKNYPTFIEINFSDGAKCSLILISFDIDGKYLDSVELAYEWAISEWYSEMYSEYNEKLNVYNVGPDFEHPYYKQPIDSIIKSYDFENGKIKLINSDTIFIKNKLFPTKK